MTTTLTTVVTLVKDDTIKNGVGRKYLTFLISHMESDSYT
jgi:hypothetical protein